MHPPVLDMQLLLAGSDRVIRVWDVQRWSLQQYLQGHTDAVHVLAGHPYDPRLVLSAGYDGLCRLWDVQAGSELQRCAAWVPFGSAIAIAAFSGGNSCEVSSTLAVHARSSRCADNLCRHCESRQS